MRLFSILAALLLLANISWAQPEVDTDEGAPLPFDPMTLTGTLDNGLRWYVRENHEPENRAELRLVLNAGSLLEDDDQRGLAHFVEHMAFNGSKHFEGNELIDYMERIGMQFGPEVNAYTGFDETVYMLTVPTDDESILDTAFQILGDWAGALSFDDEEIERERGVVIEEWRGGRGAGQRVRDRIIPVMYAGSRYAERLPIGDLEILESFAHESLERFYHDWYRPGLMAVIAVGDFDAAAMRRRIAINFGDLRDPAAERERTVFEVPPHEQTRYVVADDPELSSSRVRVALKSPSEHLETVGDYRRSVIESLWFGMFNERLGELTQKADPPYVGAFAGRGSSIRAVDEISLSARVEDDGLERGLQAVLVEAARAQRHGFTQSELERAKARRMSTLERQYNERENLPSSGYASARAANFLADSPVMGIERMYALNLALVPSITLDEVEAAAPDFFAEANRVVTVTQPEKEGVVTPDESSLRAVFASVAAMEIEPYVDELSSAALVSELPAPGRVVARSYDEDLELYTWTLSNGARVLLRPTDFKQDEILFTAYSPGGSSLGPNADAVTIDRAGWLVSSMGVGEFSPVQLQKKLAGKQVSLRPYISTIEEGMNGSCTPQDLPTFLELAYLYFTAPREDAEVFGAMMQRFAAVLENRAASPEQVYADSLAVILTQHHPRSRPLTVESLAQLDMDTAYDFYRDRFADAGDFSFVFVGALVPSLVEDMIAFWLGGLPAEGRVEDYRDLGIRTPDSVVTREIHKGQEPKARTTVVFSGDFEWNREQRHAISSLGSILEIRLRERLREDLGGTYGVSVGVDRDVDPIPSYRVRIAFGCDPERLEELSDELFAALAEMKESGPTPDEMAKVKEQQRRQFEEGLQENGTWLWSIAFRDRYGIDQREQLDTLERIDAMTAERVQAAAIRYLDFDRYVKVDLLPE